ncbi:rod shape-determining protein RodA [Cellvibrio japonicus]|uniref:Peptidoglycan glycosyltransferase MrdB n=1 Tax=Cellvibrio japonicus (strain Ueda107) TaxID=498211 RepID=B3PKN3_CELJU|nr:rod shape-determining protein RodA [Cellvibrio japonicus]ACE85315.1 rod shape-determining protein RodA [Cellvibrio japonicus Ueda107]QEI11443.1 rod shape-determining protein RodA [Cellvibrio japonicus]QEI15017.1 rod shape-determining protein RodA [Cellvibrio japonicus]QEI18597.1 rod shape-determining protein RodA [Cellvibrio japonicus]
MTRQDFLRRMPDAASAFSRRARLEERLHIDFVLLGILLVLTTIGLTVLYSASGHHLPSVEKQATFFALAYITMFVVAQIPVDFMRRMAPVAYTGGVLLLLAVTVFGDISMGAQRWLQIGSFRFQPSEIMKLAMPITLAAYLSQRFLPPRFKHVVVSLVLIGIPTALIIEQPDLGTSILVATSGLMVLFYAGLLWRYIAVAVVVFLASLWPIWHFMLHDYQRRRVLTMLDPTSDPLGAGWNIIQSKTAIGSGGLSGKGWMEGTQSRLDFLPEGHTDFIIAVMSEEFGLLGVVVLLSLYALLIGRGLTIALRSQNAFGRMLAASISTTFFVYVFVNMGMVSGMLPVVGVPLPLISQGGTAIVALFAGFGILMAIATEKKRVMTPQS